MSNVGKQTQLPGTDVVWRFSAAWLNRRLDCTLEGIQGGCHGGCCKLPYWPAKAEPQADGGCHYLGPAGCTLEHHDRPVTCHLYPLKLRDTGTITLHFRSSVACCKANVGHGPLLIDALYQNLVALFGFVEAEQIRTAILAGHDASVVVPPDVASAAAAEEVEAGAGILPPPRSTR